MNMNCTSHPFDPKTSTRIGLDHALGDIDIISSGWSGSDLQEDFRLDLAFGPEDDKHVVACRVDALRTGVVVDLDSLDQLSVGVTAITDLQTRPFVNRCHQMDKMQGEDVAVLGVEPLAAVPVDGAVSVLLSHHQEGVGLAVGGGIGAKIVNIHTVNDFGFGSLIMKVVLDAVAHVLGDGAVLKDDVAPRGVDVDAVASVVGDVGIADCHNSIGLSNVDA
jgi:hypothetical protein